MVGAGVVVAAEEAKGPLISAASLASASLAKAAVPLELPHAGGAAAGVGGGGSVGDSVVRGGLVLPIVVSPSGGGLCRFSWAAERSSILSSVTGVLATAVGIKNNSTIEE